MPILEGIRETIEGTRRQINLGLTFTTFWKNTQSVAKDEFFGIALLTNGVPPQLVYTVSAGGDVELVFYERPSLSATGTPLPIYNLNRLSGKGSVALAWHSPAVVDGTILSGGLVNTDTRWALSTGTMYVVGGINREDIPVDASIVLEWYEKELSPEGDEI